LQLNGPDFPSGQALITVPSTIDVIMRMRSESGQNKARYQIDSFPTCAPLCCMHL
jgi:hypothetical protein